MASVREFSTQVGLGNPPVSVRSLVGKFGTSSLHDAIAASKISEFYRRTGRNFGPLGVPVSGLNRQPNGSYVQDFQLGNIQLANFDAVPTSVKKIQARVIVSAVKCFGTEDPGGTDETYVVVSIINVNPNDTGVDSLVTTVRTEINNNVNAGNVIFQARTIGPELGTAFPGSGIRLHVAIFDHENGDADEIRNKIQAVLNDGAKKGAAALAGAAAADDPKLAGAAGDIVDFEIGGVKPFKILTAGLADLLTNLLADDLIGEHDFFIPAAKIAEWAIPATDNPEKFPNFEASFRTLPDVLGPSIQFNWPQKVEDEVLFGEGGGSYKIYFTIIPRIQIVPVVPTIP